jgi:hypothetical protein
VPDPACRPKPLIRDFGSEEGVKVPSTEQNHRDLSAPKKSNFLESPRLLAERLKENVDVRGCDHHEPGPVGAGEIALFLHRGDGG